MEIRYRYLLYVFPLCIMSYISLYLNWNELEYSNPNDFSQETKRQTTSHLHNLSVGIIRAPNMNVTPDNILSTVAQEEEKEVPFYKLPIGNCEFDFFRERDDSFSLISFYFFVTAAFNKILDECRTLESSKEFQEKTIIPTFCYVDVSLSGYMYTMEQHIPLSSPAAFNHPRKKIRACINLEHTLIYHPLDSPSESPYLMGRVLHKNSGSYYRLKEPMCRIMDDTNDIILEYALPNVQNYLQSGHFTDLTLKKLVYMPSLGLFDINNIGPPPTTSERLEQNNQTLKILTSFWVRETSRRSRFLDFMDSRGIQVTNVNSMTSPQKMADVYDQYHIILNVRQTDIDHTIEELRILPAIERGLIVISESAPLIEMLPYYHNVLWCDTWEAFPDMISMVIDNYAAMHSKLVGETSNLKHIILDMSKKALADLKQSLSAAYTKSYPDVGPKRANSSTHTHTIG